MIMTQIPGGGISHAQTVAVASQGRGANPVISLKLRQVPLRTAVQAIGAQAGMKVTYGEVVERSEKLVTILESRTTVQSALDHVLRGTGIRYHVNGDQIVLEKVLNTGSNRAQGIIIGKVVDAKTGKGVSGANVSIGNDAHASVTGEDGSYRLAGMVAGTHTIVVRLVGYAKQTRSVTVGEGATITADFRLEPSANVLDQVVVTGTVVSTELKAVPTAITVVTAKQIEERGITRIDQLFRGDIPGMFVRNDGSSSAVDAVTVFSRGATSLATAASAATNSIKTYIDGVEMTDGRYLSQIDPKTIERIEILTGPQASTIYGSNAINGVIQVFTKRGTNSKPQLTASLLSGIIQNNVSNALIPQHDYSAQVAGTEGRISYNVGGSWVYLGRWTPNKQTTRMGSFGSARMQGGPVTADASIRLANTTNTSKGSSLESYNVLLRAGAKLPTGGSSRSTPSTQTLDGRTLGLTIGYAPLSWWSHELVLGSDRYDLLDLKTGVANDSPSDTLLTFFNPTTNWRKSVRYSTTAQIPIATFGKLTVTTGADAWNDLSTATFLQNLPSATGSLTSTFQSVTRQPSHNSGAFVQGQLGLLDALFLTYGLRAEWNPNYGEEAQPNLAPRVGAAYTRNDGWLTTKLRGSYGRATRPPSTNQKSVAYTTDNQYGRYAQTLESPELGPQYQQGGEGGVELYLGTRASLVVTRYNQTVDDIIARPVVDSVRSLAPNPSSTVSPLDANGYGFQYQFQNLNIGSVRNQGWELQGSINMGPFTTRGTYSWTKSRVIGITRKYRAVLTSSAYQVGRSFNFLPEHTWAMTTMYSRAGSMVSLTLNGTGTLRRVSDDLTLSMGSRLDITQARKMTPVGYLPIGPAYTMADLNASHRFSPHLDGVLQIQNLTDFYRNDNQIQFTSIGRQTKVGLRVKL